MKILKHIMYCIPAVIAAAALGIMLPAFLMIIPCEAEVRIDNWYITEKIQSAAALVFAVMLWFTERAVCKEMPPRITYNFALIAAGAVSSRLLVNRLDSYFVLGKLEGTGFALGVLGKHGATGMQNVQYTASAFIFYYIVIRLAVGIIVAFVRSRKTGNTPTDNGKKLTDNGKKLTDARKFIIGAAVGVGIHTAFYGYLNFTFIFIDGYMSQSSLPLLTGIIAIVSIILLERKYHLGNTVYNFGFVIFTVWFYIIGLFFIQLADGLFREAIGAYRIYGPGMTEEGMLSIVTGVFSFLLLLIKLITGIIFHYVDKKKAAGGEANEVG